MTGGTFEDGTMKVKQLSVFLENKSGRMAAVTRALADHNLNLRAFSIADTEDYGILRAIVNDPDEALRVLKADGFTASLTDVIAVEVPDAPGGLATALETLQAAGVNIEYLYAFCEKCNANALVVLRVENIDAATRALAVAGINVLPSQDVYSL